MHFIAVSFQRVMSTLYVTSYNSVTFEIGPRIRKHFASLIFFFIQKLLSLTIPNNASENVFQIAITRKMIHLQLCPVSSDYCFLFFSWNKVEVKACFRPTLDPDLAPRITWHISNEVWWRPSYVKLILALNTMCKSSEHTSNLKSNLNASRFFTRQFENRTQRQNPTFLPNLLSQHLR